MFGLIGTLISGFIQAKVEKRLFTSAEQFAWDFYSLMMSLWISATVNFLTVWGGTALALWVGGKLSGAWLNMPQLDALPPLNIWVSLGAGFAAALFVTGIVIYNLWIASPLTKGIRIAVITRIASVATDVNMTTTERN